MLNFDTCGIEVSAKTLLVRLRRNDKRLDLRTFANTTAGRRELIRFLKNKQREVRIGVEATGTYGLDLALEISRVESFHLMVINPKTMRRFAEALRQRNKTDPADVDAIEEYVGRMPFQPWCAPAPHLLHLRAIARRMHDLTLQKAAEKNRRHAASRTASTPEAVLRDLQRSLESLAAARDELQKEALALIAQDAELHRRFKLATGIKGLGKHSAVMILAELAPLADDFTARQWVAHAGLDPRKHQSGSSIDKKPRLSKAGNVHLRRALYMPALVAAGKEPGFQAFYQHLLAHGKKPLQALCAIMRKLLHALYGMFRNDQSFDASRLFAHFQTDIATSTQPHSKTTEAYYCDMPA